MQRSISMSNESLYISIYQPNPDYIYVPSAARDHWDVYVNEEQVAPQLLDWLVVRSKKK